MDSPWAAVQDALKECARTPMWARSSQELVDGLDSVHVLTSQLTALSLELLREIDGRGIPTTQGAPTTTAWVRDRYRVSPGTACRQVKLAAALHSQLPQTAAALADGTLNPEQAHLIAKTVLKLPTQHRAMDCGHLPDNGGDRPQVVVTVNIDTLRTQIGTATLDDGTPLSPAAARRLACDARILPAIMNGAGQVLDVGRERRLFTGPIRRALTLRDGGCTFPSCDRPPRWCDGHHLISWLDNGPTNLNNGVLLCGHHQRLIHQGHWQVRIAADGLPEFIPPRYIDPEQHPQRNTYHRRE